MLGIFENPEKRRRDRDELQNLRLKYGDSLMSVLEERCGDGSLSARDRRHWNRLYRKAKRLD